MPARSLARFAPLTGAAFIVLTVVGFLVAGETPDADAPGSEVIEYFQDNEGMNILSCLLVALGSVLLLFFAANLRRALRRSEDGTGIYSVVAFGAGVVAAGGFATDAGLHFALTDFANSDGADPAAVQALNGLWSGFFFPFGVGMAALVLATSLAALRTRVIPVWLAWVGILLFGISFTPLGFVGFLGCALWVVVLSVLLWRAEEKATPASAVA